MTEASMPAVNGADQRSGFTALLWAMAIAAVALSGLLVCAYLGVSTDPRLADAEASRFATWRGVPMWVAGCIGYGLTLAALALTAGGWRGGQRLAWAVLWALAVAMLGAAAWHVGYVWPRVPLALPHKAASVLAIVTGLLVLAASPTGVRRLLPPWSAVMSTVIGVLAIGLLVGGQGSSTPWDAPANALSPPTEQHGLGTPQPPSGPAPCDILRNIQDREHMDQFADTIRYRVLRPGRGPYPRDNDLAVVHYRGLREDGSEIYSTYANGQPEIWDSRVRLWKVVTYMRPGALWRFAGLAGLTEALQRQQVPDPVLIYEVELVAVKRHDRSPSSDDQVAHGGPPVAPALE